MIDISLAPPISKEVPTCLKHPDHLTTIQLCYLLDFLSFVCLFTLGGTLGYHWLQPPNRKKHATHVAALDHIAVCLQCYKKNYLKLLRGYLYSVLLHTFLQRPTSGWKLRFKSLGFCYSRMKRAFNLISSLPSIIKDGLFQAHSKWVLLKINARWQRTEHTVRNTEYITGSSQNPAFLKTEKNNITDDATGNLHLIFEFKAQKPSNMKNEIISSGLKIM